MLANSLEALLAAPGLRDMRIADLRAIAAASSPRTCHRGQDACSAVGEGNLLPVLVAGRVSLGLRMAGERCRGWREVVLQGPGHVLAWRLLMRPERLTIVISCPGPARLLLVHLARLSPDLRLRLLKRLAVYLYGELQRLGLCPPNATAIGVLARSAVEQ